jgi:hypothetical protein
VDGLGLEGVEVRQLEIGVEHGALSCGTKN